MSTILKLLAGIILASIFLGIFLGIKAKFDRSNELSEFKGSAEGIAVIAESLSAQAPGAKMPVNITVPEECELRFENKSVVTVINGAHSYYVGVVVNGPTLTQGSYHLELTRTNNGIEVNVG